MKKIFTLIIASLICVTGIWAEEVLLGQYHFNDITSYSEVGEDDAIVMNATENIASWTVTIDESDNNVYKAYNTAKRNLNQFPLGVNISPRTGYIVQISKIEVYHKTTATTTDATQKFSYYVGTTTNVSGATDLTSETNLPTAADFTLFTHTFSTPIEISGSNNLWLYHRIKTTTYPPIATTEIDYIKFYGTYLDPNAPVITAPIGTQDIKAALVGGNVSKVIDITHANLTEAIATSSNNPAFSASFDDSGEGTYNALRITYAPSTSGYETGTITLTSGSATATVQVKGWGLPENAIAAWNFDSQSITPDYHAYVTAPSIELIGGASSSYYLDANNYFYEIGNLYTIADEVEVPEIAGMKFNNLGYNGRVNVRFDIRARNASPNTLKLGSEYWKNPNTTVGVVSNVNIETTVTSGELSVVSAFDQEVEPKVFKSISGIPLTTAAWGFDNIIIMSLMSTSNYEKMIHNIRLYANNKTLYINNNDQEGLLEIISLNGVKLQSHKISGNQNIQTDLKGIYIVRMTFNDKIMTQKVVF